VSMYAPSGLRHLVCRVAGAVGGVYRDVIGHAVRIEGDGYVEFDLDNTKFSLFERSKLPELIGREGGTAPCGEIGFLVGDVDAEADRLRGLGVQLLTGPADRPWRERTLHTADPDGNIVEYAQKLRRSAAQYRDGYRQLAIFRSAVFLPIHSSESVETRL
jgi:lactoylglutathione lyase